MDLSSPWPLKNDILGVLVSSATYDQIVNSVIRAAQSSTSSVVSCHAVHAIVTASEDRELRQQVNMFEAVTPDGQPVRWALNWLHQARLKDRVYGPELMLRLCSAASKHQLGIFLLGSQPSTLEQLQQNLLVQFPNLRVSGTHSPPFRELTPEEDQALIDEINGSGAKIIFVGLGCPKQDRFAHQHRNQFSAVQVCVGAAFDFHAGTVPMAPSWMQNCGLEWLYRLHREPRRLWKRYLYTNTRFVLMMGKQKIQRWCQWFHPGDAKQ